MKNILIAGGAGFIGSHLCKKLIQNKNNKIICVDNLITGFKKNINTIIKNSNFVFLQKDICVPFEVNEEIDEIYNLACPASPKAYTKYPIETIRSSTMGVENLLKIANRYNSKILHASTSEIYGDPLEHPQKENYWGNVNPIGERSCYNEGKRCAESLLYNYHNVFKMDIKIVRIFNTYGQYMEIGDGRIISNFIVQALTNNFITIYGDGQQTRSFCYIDDTIKGLIKIMKTHIDTPINIGNDKEYTVNNICDLILKLTKSSSKKIYKALPSDDPHRRKPDISLAKNKLKWCPKIDIQEGLIKTIYYFRKIL